MKSKFQFNAESFASLVSAAAAIAGDLGQGWQVLPAEYREDYGVHRVCLACSDGRKIALTAEEYDFNRFGKIKVSGVFDYGTPEVDIYWGNNRRPSIEVSLSRGPVAIAGEVRRRLLQDYNRLFQTIAQQVQEKREYKASKETAAARLAAVVNPPRFTAGDTSFWFSSGSMRCEVDVMSDINVKFYGASVETVEAILRLLAGK